MVDCFQLLCGIAILCLAIYYYYTSRCNFWSERGIPGPKPEFLFGNFKDSVLRKAALGELLKRYYDQYKHEPVFGIYQNKTPLLVVNNLDLIKDVLIKDFSLFADRGMPVFKKAEPLSQHLFLLEPKKWRPLRIRLSPVFTSGKIRDMLPLIVDCAKHLETYLDMLVAKGGPVECRELTAKFTTDVIGNCAFGIDTNSLSKEDSEFRRMGRKIFSPTFAQTFRLYLKQFLPKLYEFLGTTIQNTELNNFFINMTMSTIRYREQNNVYRPDFINTLMELWKNPEKMDSIELTDEVLTSQALVFFVAGFETSSTTISHALYELALNQDMQDKLRSEIREHFAKNGEVLTCEHIKNLKYLDVIFKETLRKYPVLAILMREVVENYTFRGTNITIPKGTKVWIPVYGIQRDPDIYPNPDIFDPERFTDEAQASRHPMSFLPFGDGPRNCIGARFAVYQSKIGILTILRNHKVDVCEKTTIPYVLDPAQFLVVPKNGVHLTITKLET